VRGWGAEVRLRTLFCIREIKVPIIHQIFYLLLAMRQARRFMQKTMRKYWPVFVLPTMAAFVIGFIVPFIYGIFLSFCKFTTVTDWKFTGLLNYTRILFVNGKLDTTFLHSLWYTMLFTLVTVLIINVASFAIAMALTKGIKGTNLFRTSFFLPNLIGGIVLSYIWLMIFNAILQKHSMTIVSTQWTAFWGMVAVVCWQQIGYMMIIYVAGIQNISPDLIEAAKIDGANNFQLLKSVILPMLRPTITICTFLTLTNGFKLFDQNLALTGGNPGKMSELLALNIYNTMYGTTGWQGVGQAKAVLFFIFVAIIALAQNKITTRKEVEL
jgi:raffinose/stachyose/melibiose transport system permease protein